MIIIGYGPGAVSRLFETPHPGFPGSPSHVLAKNLTSDSAILCWRESAIGKPFTVYSIQITESGATEKSKVLRVNASAVHAVPYVNAVTDCNSGVKVCTA